MGEFVADNQVRMLDTIDRSNWIIVLPRQFLAPAERHWRGLSARVSRAFPLFFESRKRTIFLFPNAFRTENLPTFPGIALSEKPSLISRAHKPIRIATPNRTMAIALYSIGFVATRAQRRDHCGLRLQGKQETARSSARASAASMRFRPASTDVDWRTIDEGWQ